MCIFSQAVELCSFNQAVECAVSVRQMRVQSISIKIGHDNDGTKYPLKNQQLRVLPSLSIDGSASDEESCGTKAEKDAWHL